MTSALKDIGKAFAGNRATPPASGSIVSQNPSGAQEGSKPPISSASSTPTSTSATVPRVDIGDYFSTDLLDIRVVSAKIGDTQLRTIMGDLGTGKTPDLQIELEVKNTHDRKIIRFRDNTFMPSFKLRDDVDNVIRGINFGSNKVVGAIQSSDDLLPGSTTSHIEVFSVPPPNTEHLILICDLGAFGGEGTVEFFIPFSSVQQEE